MLQVKYVGVFDEVLVPEYGPVPVKRGEPIEVDASLAERLVAQRANWQPVKTTKEREG